MASICIIIPVYKGEQYINDLIQMFDKASIMLHQVYSEVNIQLAFINDFPEVALTKSSWTCSEHIECTFFNPGIHQGIHAARIFGLDHTSSDYVIFFDQDDLVVPQYLLSQFRRINACRASYDGVICNGIYRGNRMIYSDSRPMQMTFDRKALLEKKWYPISTGQVMIKRVSIPIAQWRRYILKRNLMDDWLLWFLMVHNNNRFVLNKDVLYTHVEHGSNATQNWKEMGEARIELHEVLGKLGVLMKEEETIYQHRMDMFLSKYKDYIEIDELLERVDQKELINRIRKKTDGLRVSIYGIGIYGQKILRLLYDAGTTVSFCIDQHAGAIQDSEIQVYSTNERQYPETDMVIVTPLFAFDEIKSTTLKNFRCPILRMDEFIKDCLEY